MLTGTYYHTLEEKGRFSLPKAWRGESDSWVVTAGLDGCVFIYKLQEWESEMQQLQTLSYYKADHRAVVRHLSSHASQQQPDSLGRLTLTEDLRGLLGEGKDLVLVGTLGRIEVWERERYHQYFDKLAQTVEEKSEELNWER